MYSTLMSTLRDVVIYWRSSLFNSV